MYENLSEPMPLKKEIKLYTGTGNPELSQKIADILHLELQGLKIEKFANGEIYARFDESVRGDDVFFIQSLSGASVNDLLMETLVVADAAKRASVSKFTAVLPHYCYARQDRKAAAREPITARLVANLLEAAGVDQVITVDLHQGQIQGFFDIPVTHLTALYLIGDYFREKDFDWTNTVVVSPDMGRAKVAKRLADYLGCEVAIAHKSRPKHNASEVMGIIGNIEGKTCIVNDDMIDTAGTLCNSVPSATPSASSRRWAPATSTSPPRTASSPARPSSASRTPRSWSASSPTSSPARLPTSPAPRSRPSRLPTSSRRPSTASTCVAPSPRSSAAAAPRSDRPRNPCAPFGAAFGRPRCMCGHVRAGPARRALKKPELWQSRPPRRLGIRGCPRHGGAHA